MARYFAKQKNSVPHSRSLHKKSLPLWRKYGITKIRTHRKLFN